MSFLPCVATAHSCEGLQLLGGAGVMPVTFWRGFPSATSNAVPAQASQAAQSSCNVYEWVVEWVS